ncbi:MAG: pyruvate kinase [Oscillospiraceae bacterium]|nr:pyruvate kinase [Oscillospiraceae bacterium]
MTQIYGTLGPRCEDEGILKQMFQAGMTGIRINLSHTDLQSSAELIRRGRRAGESCGMVPQLLMDMQGPELRLGKVEQEILLTPGCTYALDLLPLPELILPWLLPGQQMLLDDGKLLLEVQAGGRFAVLRGGPVKSRKSIALPGCQLHPPTLTEKDLQNIALAAQYGITGLMQPFVRDAQDLRNVRQALGRAGAGHIELFAKIENMDGVEHLNELIPECDEIVIARGDLGNAMPLWELPAVPKQISDCCRAAGRRFMVVTQMLASMEHSAVPTRAEVSDIFQAVLSGAASVMVTGETAAGDYPVEVIRYLKNTAAQAEKLLHT